MKKPAREGNNDLACSRCKRQGTEIETLYYVCSDCMQEIRKNEMVIKKSQKESKDG